MAPGAARLREEAVYLDPLPPGDGPPPLLEHRRVTRVVGHIERRLAERVALAQRERRLLDDVGELLRRLDGQMRRRRPLGRAAPSLQMPSEEAALASYGTAQTPL